MEGIITRRIALPPEKEYRIIADLNVTTAVTQVDFENLNIGKEDELRLVYTLVGDSTSTASYLFNVNDITSNYHSQVLFGSGSTIGAGRLSTSEFSIARSNRPTSGFADIKISNNGNFVAQSQYAWRIGGDASDIENTNHNIANTGTVTSITKLSVVSNRTDGIAVGSRLQLYKVVK